MVTASILIHGQLEKRTNILQIIKETRCRQVMIYQDIDGENTFFFVEIWVTERNPDQYLSSRLLIASCRSN